MVDPNVPAPVDTTRDYYCGRGKYCELGISYQNPIYNPSLYDDIVDIKLKSFLKPETTNEYNMTEIQRFFVSVNPFTFTSEGDLVSEYAVKQCDIKSLCSRNDFYFDQSTFISPPGYYRPYENCDDPIPNEDFDMYFSGFKGLRRFQITRDSNEMTRYLIRTNIHKKVCFFNPGCIGVPENERATKCCSRGWCTCPA
jgi:hypothetical protein